MARCGYAGAVGVLGTLATACFLVGFIAPGWIVMKRSLEEFDVPMDLFMTPERMQAMRTPDGDDIGDEDMPMPMNEQDLIRDRRQAMHMRDMKDPELDEQHPMPGMDDGMPDTTNHMRSGSSSSESDDEDDNRRHHGPHHNEPDWQQGMPSDQNEFSRRTGERQMEEWAENGFGLAEAMGGIQMKSLHLHVSFGLWYTVYCVKVHDDTWNMMEEHDNKGQCSCLKMSTDHALNYAYLFNSFGWQGMPTYEQGHNRFSRGNMGGASLTEHRVESTMAVIFCLIGLISGIIGFGKAKGLRCLQCVCALALLISMILFMIPSVRLAKFSHKKSAMSEGNHLKMPYSAVAVLVGCLFAFITLLVAIIGMVRKYRQEEAPGKWNKFRNEFVADITSDMKKPALVFLNEPLPEKQGLYDVCDVSDMKPAEECELDNKPIA